MKLTLHDGLGSMGREADRGGAGHRLMLVTGRFFSRRPPSVTMTSVLPPERGGDGGQRPVGSRRAGLPFEFLWTALLTIGRTASTHLGLWTLTST
jgi:hypothetical protein